MVILNDKLRDIYGNLPIRQAFGKADNILSTAAKSIAEIITETQDVNVDFEDVKTVMKDAGAAVMGSAMEEGEGRAIKAAEKAISAYGSIEMSFLERGLVWLSLFIAIAPLFGFLGTVVGMIEAFDDIEAAADISPSIVAGGIKTALLTTAGGLIAGIILQIGYNYCVSKIDRLIADMEESSITLIDSIIMLNEGKDLVPPSTSESDA